MKKGSLKWTEIIYREVEPEDLAKVDKELMDEYETSVTIEVEIDGTYTVSCKVLTEGWKDLPIGE